MFLGARSATPGPPSQTKIVIKRAIFSISEELLEESKPDAAYAA
jgi:hypothetical protein